MLCTQRLGVVGCTSDHDATARAFWCGGIAATASMARIIDR